MDKKLERYFVDRDNSGHWYLIPVRARNEWNAWSDLDENDPVSWDAPSCAREIDNLSHLTFADPRVR